MSDDTDGRKYIHKILVKMEPMNKEQKIAYLQSLRKDQQLMYLLRLVYDDRVKLKPFEFPPYKSEPTSHFTLSYSSLRHELRRFYIFLDMKKNTVPHVKMVNNLVQILESIPNEEAVIVKTMFERRRLPYKGVTQALVHEALPELFA